MGQHSSASASRLLDLDGFEVLAAEITGGEWQLEVQTRAPLVGCQGCGMRAQLHGRRLVRVRDLPERTVNPPIAPVRCNFLYPPLKVALQTAAKGGRPRRHNRDR